MITKLSRIFQSIIWEVSNTFYNEVGFFIKLFCHLERCTRYIYSLFLLLTNTHTYVYRLILTWSLSSACCCVSPLTLNTSAVLRKDESDLWCTFTSPWYMNSTRACRSVQATSCSTITGCLHGVDCNKEFLRWNFRIVWLFSISIVPWAVPWSRGYRRTGRPCAPWDFYHRRRGWHRQNPRHPSNFQRRTLCCSDSCSSAGKNVACPPF